jgi:hypothetical protein
MRPGIPRNRLFQIFDGLRKRDGNNGALAKYLADRLYEVRTILVVGWQAKEAHFISTVRNRLPKLARIMCVGANADDARATLKFFSEEIGLHVANSIPAQGGFTDFVVARQWESFLNS